ncbi:MAG: DUF2786 domain-containing protein [Acidimicrobiales bacterium]
MGRRSRERRRLAERRMRREGPARAGAREHERGEPQPPPGDFGRRGVEDVVIEAAHARCTGDPARLDQLVDLLAAGPAGGDRCSQVDAALAGCLQRAVGSAWQCGWQPADVPREMRRRLGAGHASLVSAAIAVESRRYAASSCDPRWRSQLAALGVDLGPGLATVADDAWVVAGGGARPDAVRRAVDCLWALLHLRVLPHLCRLPGEGHSATATAASGGARLLERVRALLAKAESTSFPEEAEALTAKAQELMTRHAIDRAAVEGTRQAPSAWRIPIDNPYASAKSILLHQVASANRCRSVWDDSLGSSTVFGYEVDLDTVELLYTSLLVQATTAMTRAGSQVDRRGRSRTRSFRQSFLVGFATRIGVRLRDASSAGEASAEQDHGPSLLPVLVERRGAVDDACSTAFPHLVSRAHTTTNGAGWIAGQAAAQLASLSPYHPIEGARRALA